MVNYSVKKFIKMVKKKEGKHKGWMPGGRLQYEYLYKNGKKEIHKAWCENGQLVYEKYYTRGRDYIIEKISPHHMLYL